MKRQDAEEDLDVNMTPMLDIVFIMLIFFIVTAVFVKPPGVEVIRPEAGSATDVKRVSIIIGIGKDNRIWINKRQVEPEDVRVIVAKLKAENPKGKVVIKADTNSHSGLVVAIVEQLNQIGIAGVSIAAKPGEGA
ncbi:MAG TPA: biopolymer transporter ExbD [Gammaproteobacteria bacterium]|jgi:biopolymer transport protein ExbD